jgi:hypothetical protein
MPRLLPLVLSSCFSSIVVGQIAKPLSNDTYLCTHARIRVLGAQGHLSLDAPVIGIALGWGIGSVAVLACVYLGSTLLPMKNSFHSAVKYISDPFVAYEQWMAIPMYNLAARRLDATNYEIHRAHFRKNTRPQKACRFCDAINVLMEKNEKIELHGEQLFYSLIGVPPQLPEFEQIVEEAKKAWAHDPTDINNLDIHLKRLNGSSNRIEHDVKALGSQNELRLAEARRECEGKQEKLRSILDMYNTLKQRSDAFRRARTASGCAADLQEAVEEVELMLQEHGRTFELFEPNRSRDTKGFRLLKEAKEMILSLDRDDEAGDMCDAAAKGNLDRLKRLVQKRCAVDNGDYDHRTPLHLAASTGNLTVVKALIEEFGAMHSPRDRWHGTPLDDAIRHKHADVAQYLAAKDADMGLMAHHDQEHAATEMCKAAYAGNSKHLTTLIKRHDIHVNVGDYDMRTALHLAACEGHLQTVKSLVEDHGADISVKDRWGNTPLLDAQREKKHIIEKYLKEREHLAGDDHE